MLAPCDGNALRNAYNAYIIAAFLIVVQHGSSLQFTADRSFVVGNVFERDANTCVR